ncbi:MAG TPA: helix-turn-helix transcriptional regulator [Candidatus Paceibacterota bacterium]|jgi:transcriptional regulator with XRE-family HTH domain|nr:helix-turn-helix transcriptional regulator [Candidatus Paceibacterota bacterium]
MEASVSGIGTKIKKFRTDRGWSQKRLGEFLDYSESLISYIENGQRSFNVNDLHKLSDVFKVPYDLFLDNHTSNFRTHLIEENKKENYDKVMDDFIKFANDKLKNK